MERATLKQTFTLLLFSACCGLLDWVAEAAAGEDPAAARVEAAVKDLESADVAKRQKAVYTLWELGDAAQPH